VKRHELTNGVLMRSDLHRLFDEGYLTVDPTDRCVVVSKRIREEFENGRDYYKLEGQAIREPVEAWARPSLRIWSTTLTLCFDEAPYSVILSMSNLEY